MKVKDIAAAVENIAPKKLAQDWDNTGLLVGDAEQNVKKMLVTIDVTKDVVAEAVKLKTDMILSYHPVIWDGLKNITPEGEGAVVYELVKAGISVYSIHTSFDVVAGGVNDALADMLGIADAEPIGDYVEAPAGVFYKMVVFVPVDNVNAVADALYSAGAGAIGNYSHCGFQSEGVGTFLPLDGAKPAIGKKGKLEEVYEVKLESIVAEDKVPACIAAMKAAHPYETPAFDVFRHYNMESKLGLGRIGMLKEPTSLDKLIEKIKKTTGAKAAGIVGKNKRTVKKAAVCAGSCGKIINTIIAEKCDLYVTGEIKHHQAIAAQEAGLTCICLSHTVSERFALKNLIKNLKIPLKGVTIALSKKDADPFTWKSI